MQFMTVFTFEPDKRDAVVKRRMEHGIQMPAGLKLLGQWSYIGGGRVFMLVESDDPASLLARARTVSDLGKFDIYPVMETEEALKLIASK